MTKGQVILLKMGAAGGGSLSFLSKENAARSELIIWRTKFIWG